MKAYLFKIMSISLFLLFPVCALAHDSTDIRPQPVTNVLPNVLYTDDCLDTGNITATHTPLFVATWGTQETSCPLGYIARKMKIYVAVGLNSGEWDWKLSCCRARVTYD